VPKGWREQFLTPLRSIGFRHSQPNAERRPKLRTSSRQWRLRGFDCDLHQAISQFEAAWRKLRPNYTDADFSDYAARARTACEVDRRAASFRPKPWKAAHAAFAVRRLTSRVWLSTSRQRTLSKLSTCNLHSITTNQSAIAALFRVMESKNKEVVWLAINDDRPLTCFAGIWTEFKGDRGTKSKPICGPHTVYGAESRLRGRRP
jgi:hypothetical protein